MAKFLQRPLFAHPSQLCLQGCTKNPSKPRKSRLGRPPARLRRRCRRHRRRQRSWRATARRSRRWSTGKTVMLTSPETRWGSTASLRCGPRRRSTAPGCWGPSPKWPAATKKRPGGRGPAEQDMSKMSNWQKNKHKQKTAVGEIPARGGDPNWPDTISINTQQRGPTRGLLSGKLKNKFSQREAWAQGPFYPPDHLSEWKHASCFKRDCSDTRKLLDPTRKTKPTTWKQVDSCWMDFQLFPADVWCTYWKYM